MQVSNVANSAAHLAAATDPSGSGAASNTDSTSSDPGTALSVDSLANTSTFLQLLVAQIKNQDPLQPTDGIQFVTQLAQFSSLEQLIGIRKELGTSNQPATNDPAANSAVPTA